MTPSKTPGLASGWLTARLSHALTAIAKDASLVLDLHEAQPEYPVINMMVAHERAFEVAATATATMQTGRIPIGLSASPKNLHGLSHREFGDHAHAQATLRDADYALDQLRVRATDSLLTTLGDGDRDAGWKALGQNEAARCHRLQRGESS